MVSALVKALMEGFIGTIKINFTKRKKEKRKGRKSKKKIKTDN